MRHKARLLGGLAGVGAALTVGAVAAFACINIVTLNLTPNSVTPGTTVTASMPGYSSSTPVPAISFHWGTVNGPVLATAVPTASGTTATFTVPQVTTAGDYVVIATQPQSTAGGTTYGMPARAVLHVTMPGGDAVVPANAGGAATSSNPAGLSTQAGMSAGVLALIGVGVAAVALMIVGVAVWGADRMAPKAEKVRKA